MGAKYIWMEVVANSVRAANLVQCRELTCPTSSRRLAVVRRSGCFGYEGGAHSQVQKYTVNPISSESVPHLHCVAPQSIRDALGYMATKDKFHGGRCA